MKKLGIAVGILVALSAATFGYLRYEEWRDYHEWVQFGRDIKAARRRSALDARGLTLS